MTYEATDADLDAIAAEKKAWDPNELFEPVETTAELLRRLTKERNEAVAAADDSGLTALYSSEALEALKVTYAKVKAERDGLQVERDSLAAKLARVEALADEWEHLSGRPESWWRVGAALRATLANPVPTGAAFEPLADAPTEDEPTVCVTHGAFLPCRKDGEHLTTSNPFWVKSVADFQGSTDPHLTWERVSHV